MSFFRKMRKAALRMVSQRSGYIDWSAIPREYRHVAIDANPTISQLGREVYPAGVPIAYAVDIKYDGINGHWLQTVPRRLLIVDKSAIIGPLPKSKDSHIQRPAERL